MQSLLAGGSYRSDAFVAVRLRHYPGRLVRDVASRDEVEVMKLGEP